MNIFKRLIIIFICFAFAALLLKGGHFVFKKYVFDIEEPYYAKVVEVKGHILRFDNNEIALLAGVEIPWGKGTINHIPKLLETSERILLDKKVKVEIVERPRTGAYHKHDLVRIYLEDGTCVNDYLLENGLAFFSHGYYRGKDRAFELEAKAKKEKKGIWANKDKLTLLYVGSKHWEGVHYPECPEAKKIKPEDRIEYYNRLPKVHWYRDGYPEGCPYCDEIRKTKPEHLR